MSVVAVIQLDFAPVIDLGAIEVPLQALGLAVACGLALALFAARIRRVDPGVPTGDIAFVVLAAVPGAVVGGRLVHGLANAAGYTLDPGALFDLGRGSVSLAGAILGGALTAGYVCLQLGRRPRLWADAAAIPVLVAIGLGKLAMLLGGAGQGRPYDGRGGVAFGGEGPWASTDAAIPAYPAQLLEGAWALLGIPVVALAGRRWRRAGPGAPGRSAVAAVAWWLAGRTMVAVWWRDRPLAGPWGGEGLAALGLLLLAVAALVVMTKRGPTSDQGPYPGARSAA